MATIKSLLSTALESFLTSKKTWVGEQSFPSTTTVDFVVPTTSTTVTILYAPADGWVTVETGVNYQSTVYIYNYATEIYNFATISGRTATFMPVRKGDKIEVRYKTYTAKFYYAKSSV